MSVIDESFIIDDYSCIKWNLERLEFLKENMFKAADADKQHWNDVAVYFLTRINEELTSVVKDMRGLSIIKKHADEGA